MPFALDPYPSTYQPLPRVDTLIVSATVFDGLGGRFENMSVLLQDGKIVEIGSAIQAPVGAAVIDAKGRWVTPGLIDVHTHIGDYPIPITPRDFRLNDVNEATDPNTANVWAEHSVTAQDPQFSRALAGGVTTLQVLPGSSNLFGGRGVVLKNVPATTMQAMKFPGARQSLKMACGENPKNNYGGKGRFPSSRMGSFAGYRAEWAKAKEYVAKWQAYQRSADATEPPTRDLKLDTLAAALQGDLLVHIHCYRADEMAMMIDLSREFGYRVAAFHHAVESYKIAPLLAQAGICSAVWSDWWGFKMEALDGVRSNAAILQASGACTTLHSDTTQIGQRLTLEVAKAVAGGHRIGIDIAPERAIGWVTSDAARVLQLDDRTGSLATGKNADVVIWSADPLSIYSRADQVFIDGALVYDRRDPRRQPRADFEVGQPAQGALR